MKISSNIIRVASEFKITTIELSKKNHTNILFGEIKETYIYKTTGVFVWDKMVDYFSVCYSNAWQYINEFIQNTNTIMFLLYKEVLFKFKNCDVVVSLLAEMYPFEFFLSDENLTYLLCYNHHDYLIASGTAKEWLKNR